MQRDVFLLLDMTHACRQIIRFLERMARMRDKLIHHYRGVDLHEIWKAASIEIPRLISFLEKNIHD